MRFRNSFTVAGTALALLQLCVVHAAVNAVGDTEITAKVSRLAEYSQNCAEALTDLANETASLVEGLASEAEFLRDNKHLSGQATLKEIYTAASQRLEQIFSYRSRIGEATGDIRPELEDYRLTIQEPINVLTAALDRTAKADFSKATSAHQDLLRMCQSKKDGTLAILETLMQRTVVNCNARDYRRAKDEAKLYGMATQLFSTLAPDAFSEAGSHDPMYQSFRDVFNDVLHGLTNMPMAEAAQALNELNKTFPMPFHNASSAEVALRRDNLVKRVARRYVGSDSCLWRYAAVGYKSGPICTLADNVRLDLLRLIQLDVVCGSSTEQKTSGKAKSMDGLTQLVSSIASDSSDIILDDSKVCFPDTMEDDMRAGKVYSSGDSNSDIAKKAVNYVNAHCNYKKWYFSAVAFGARFKYHDDFGIADYSWSDGGGHTKTDALICAGCTGNNVFAVRYKMTDYDKKVSQQAAAKFDSLDQCFWHNLVNGRKKDQAMRSGVEYCWRYKPASTPGVTGAIWIQRLNTCLWCGGGGNGGPINEGFASTRGNDYKVWRGKWEPREGDDFHNYYYWTIYFFLGGVNM